MDIRVAPVRTNKELDEFIKLPWKIYKGYSNWVPPMIKDMDASLKDVLNDVTDNGKGHDSRIKRELFLAYEKCASDDGKPVGRIYCGYDMNLNEKKGIRLGFFSLFECIENEDVAGALLDAARGWFRENGIDTFIGPTSMTGTDGDEYKGLLIDGFERPPSIMTTYNPPYYQRLLENYGLVKDYDIFAYYLDKVTLFKKDPARIIEYAQKRYDFRVDTFDMDNLEREIRDIHHVMELAIPSEWADLVAPSLDEVRKMADKLIPFADPDLIAIARSRSGDEAIGFDIALPDWNQVLIHMNGKMTPLSILKYLWYKRKVNAARVFVMFVIPAFRSKGVSFGIYYKTFMEGIRKGYTWGEASTIGETNKRMRSDVESFGAKHYKTYRIYRATV